MTLLTIVISVEFVISCLTVTVNLQLLHRVYSVLKVFYRFIVCMCNS